MITYFLDTSALTKAFIQEKGSDRMTALLERTADQFKAASALTVVELPSAIRRRSYSGDITQEHSDSAVRVAAEETRRMILHPISDAVMQEAVRLVDSQKLRSLDAIQLATALTAAQTASTLSRSLIFVAADKQLLAAAVAEGLRTWNPETSSEEV